MIMRMATQINFMANLLPRSSRVTLARTPVINMSVPVIYTKHTNQSAAEFAPPSTGLGGALQSIIAETLVEVTRLVVFRSAHPKPIPKALGNMP